MFWPQRCQQIRGSVLNQVRMLEFYSGLSKKDHVAFRWFVQGNALC